ncbi:UbiA prenyltransferase family-domain containing protein [Nitzschia inconspicua]|uniref:4-hydroxybenzoate polyprenyltransferase, mitochondrial n=1 Tax=Nitzschia inconspicua TaxID=303405 RepID=A0A9K3L5J6_9STRA|nr:UbiA prenyltransferase family-domain containing protein [Nitzschia inconspicua]
MGPSSSLISGRKRLRYRVQSICHSPTFISWRRSFSTEQNSNSNKDTEEPQFPSKKTKNTTTKNTTTTITTTVDDDSYPMTTTNSHNSINSDPPMATWVEDYLPVSMQPYAKLSRMDKPIGTWLLLWPCYWSTAMAAATAAVTTDCSTSTTATTTTTITTVEQMNLPSFFPDPYLLSLFTVGAFVMRGAGCTMNDFWDQEFDKKVRRTATRPLASGQITSNQAVQWLAVQLGLGCAVLVSLPHTMYTFGWGVASLPLVVLYPLMKRYTKYPQLVLGFTFNWGCWMGWAAAFGEMDYAIIAPLYVSGIAWTMVYDTIYANQDKEDDAAIGLHSTALTFGSNGDEQQKRILHGFAALAYTGWLLSGYNLYVSDLASWNTTNLAALGVYGVGVSSAYGHLIWQIHTADFNNPHNLAERFRSNSVVGAIVFVSIVAGNATAAATTATNLL